MYLLKHPLKSHFVHLAPGGRAGFVADPEHALTFPTLTAAWEVRPLYNQALRLGLLVWQTGPDGGIVALPYDADARDFRERWLRVFPYTGFNDFLLLDNVAGLRYLQGADGGFDAEEFTCTLGRPERALRVIVLDPTHQPERRIQVWTDDPELGCTELIAAFTTADYLLAWLRAECA